ncbi:DUF2909 domain-containing protein [Parashewanella spongiae]|uniref:DUF2909 domain-containing protein n=1 Tax=Parashewanella spongiae TaxID=342950 RepID=A0A3A6TXI7_9GAMM|nr:DUF2909 domain-containing protein [Parashewanella spongiae]MCL1077868.1 DUF2909 domain-containing protein [Parashewanella spongiae]RJY17613.1 DUF2909 domain-containing protein [Parashewanella spongiae]
MDTLLLFKLVLVLLLLFIIFNLGRALVIMVKSDNKHPMSHYLGRRVLISALVVVALILAIGFGWLHPNPTPF